MKKHKKRIVILILSIVIYLLINYIYNNFVINKNNIKVYALKQEINMGEEIDLNKVKLISINSINNINNDYITNIDDVKDMVSNIKLLKDQLLLKSNLVEKTSYLSGEEDKEIVSINIKNSDDLVSYQLKENNIVNIYYTGSIEQTKSIININDAVGYADNKKEGFVTICLLEKISILGLYDKYGNKIDNKTLITGEKNLIDTIMIKTDKNTIKKINNLKKYGTFSISITK